MKLRTSLSWEVRALGKPLSLKQCFTRVGVIKRRGSVESGNTVSDYFPVEKEYGYSVFSTVFSVEWQDRKLNFIDCPGSDDFIGGAVSALNVTDTALMVLSPVRRGSRYNQPVPVYRTIS